MKHDIQLTVLKNGEIDAIDAAARFALQFSDPVAKINEMFPDEDDKVKQEGANGTPSEGNTTRPIQHFELVDDSSEATNSENQSQADERPSHEPIEDASAVDITAIVSPARRGSRQHDLRYRCGEDNCAASRKASKGMRPYKSFAQHYNSHHPGLFLDKRKIVPHRDGPGGAKCPKMRRRRANEIRGEGTRLRVYKDREELQQAKLESQTDRDQNLGL